MTHSGRRQPQLVRYWDCSNLYVDENLMRCLNLNRGCQQKKTRQNAIKFYSKRKCTRHTHGCCWAHPPTQTPQTKKVSSGGRWRRSSDTMRERRREGYTRCWRGRLWRSFWAWTTQSKANGQKHQLMLNKQHSFSQHSVSVRETIT